jgi:DnaJ-class molecular chaperone
MDERNLNIEDYSFAEVLKLFGLTRDISEEEIIRARRKTLMMHPDRKSTRLNSSHLRRSRMPSSA